MLRATAHCRPFLHTPETCKRPIIDHRSMVQAAQLLKTQTLLRLCVRPASAASISSTARGLRLILLEVRESGAKHLEGRIAWRGHIGGPCWQLSALNRRGATCCCSPRQGAACCCSPGGGWLACGCRPGRPKGRLRCDGESKRTQVQELERRWNRRRRKTFVQESRLTRSQRAGSRDEKAVWADPEARNTAGQRQRDVVCAHSCAPLKHQREVEEASAA